MAAALGDTLAAAAPERFGGPQSNGHQRRLDGLRGVAVLTVVLFHAALGTRAAVNSWYGRIIFEFDFPIPAFFMLSAFLLYRPMFATRFQGRPSPSRRRYFKRRLARVVPAYWVALTIAGLLAVAPGVFGDRWWMFYGFAQIYSSTTFPQGLAVAWTLCVEVSLYFALPLIDITIRALGRLLRTHSWKPDVGFLLGLGLLSSAFQIWGGNTNPLLEHTLLGLFDWVLPGMLLAIVTVIYAEREVLELPRWLRFVVHKPLICWIGAAFLVLANVPLINSRTYLLDPGAISHFAGELGFFSQVAIASLLVLPGIIPGVESGVIGLPRRVLSMRWLGWIGTISYGIYLWHEPMMSELYKLGLFNLSGSQTLNLFVAALALSIVIASVSWYLMEQPLLRRVR